MPEPKEGAHRFIAMNMAQVADVTGKLAAVAKAAKALFEEEFPDLIANYDTGKGDAEGDYARECPDDYSRWRALKDALAEFEEFEGGELRRFRFKTGDTVTY
jgi:hypothetical protein